MRGDLALLWHQIRYEQLTFWRNPQSAFFTFAFPVVIITIFGALFGGGQQTLLLRPHRPAVLRGHHRGDLRAGRLLQPAGDRAVDAAAERHAQAGPGDPAAGGTYFLGLLAHCVLVSVVDVALILGVGRLFGVPLPGRPVAGARGDTGTRRAASFCALGVAVASLIRNAEAAPAVVQFVLFPLVFVSGTYMPIHSGLLNRIASVLPVRPFNQALLGPFAEPHGTSTGQASACCSPGGSQGRWSPSGGSAGTPVRSDRQPARRGCLPRPPRCGPDHGR